MPSSGASVRTIPGKGRGVVAERAIAAGEIIDRAFTIELNPADCEAIARSVLDHYYFAHPESQDMGLLVLGLASLANHADDPNTGVDWHQAPGIGWVGNLVALKPIAAGEEITRRYTCAPWFEIAA
jgi:hypothetical protein